MPTAPIPSAHPLSLWQRCLIVAAASLSVLAGLALTWHFLGPRSVLGAFLVCFLPTSWAFCVKRAIPVRLPAGYYPLRAWETQGRFYERLGVRAFQRLLRTRLLGLLNLDIPRQFRQRDYKKAEWEMRYAETSHALVFLFVCGITIFALVRRWWDAVAYLTLFNLLVNVYPILLQRYNRARMQRLIEKRHGRSSP